MLAALRDATRLEGDSLISRVGAPGARLLPLGRGRAYELEVDERARSEIAVVVPHLPLRDLVAQARGTEEIIAAKLDPDPMRYITWGSKSLQNFDHLEDRNLELYEEILKEARARFEPGIRFPRK